MPFDNVITYLVLCMPIYHYSLLNIFNLDDFGCNRKVTLYIKKKIKLCSKISSSSYVWINRDITSKVLIFLVSMLSSYSFFFIIRHTFIYVYILKFVWTRIFFFFLFFTIFLPSVFSFLFSMVIFIWLITISLDKSILI